MEEYGLWSTGWVQGSEDDDWTGQPAQLLTSSLNLNKWNGMPIQKKVLSSLTVDSLIVDCSKETE